MPSASPAPKLSAEILDPQWLASHLYREFPGVRVIGAKEIWREENTATKVRAEVEVENAPPALCRTICFKGMLDETGSKVQAYGATVTESRFYSDLAPRLPAHGINVPTCLYTAIDETTGHGIMIMRNLVADGATFLTALTPYSADDARRSLSQLARLHAATGPGKPLHGVPLFGITLAQMAERPVVPIERTQELMDGPRREPLPDEICDAARIHRSLGALLALLAGEPQCIVHGDAHAGNLYQLPGAAGIIDWQLVQLGHWSQDVAYHIAAALSVEDRRAHEDALLEHYLAERSALGDPVAALPRARTHYRAAVLYGYYLWAITQRVNPRITVEFVKRLGLAVAEHDAMGLVGV